MTHIRTLLASLITLRLFGVHYCHGYDVQPVYRWYLPSNGDHFFTKEATENAGVYGYVSEGIAFYTLKSQEENSLPIYRFSLPSGDHFYTTSSDEASTITGSAEGNIGYAFITQVTDSLPIHRYYDPDTNVKIIFILSILRESHSMGTETMVSLAMFSTQLKVFGTRQQTQIHPDSWTRRYQHRLARQDIILPPRVVDPVRSRVASPAQAIIFADNVRRECPLDQAITPRYLVDFTSTAAST
eukprot:TRINITY_DN17158_c0_g1_i1.p1 TRINITY_DN17158_c0_g1~~TRINITY_DN17158_c0_g1_i1.p1  ORF type:complete len:242 (-),score=-3.95 TRINITY_DN17158_c0_g1_i1:71-796(-)